MIRDFQLKHPLTDSKIRIWVLPVEGYEGHEKGYEGYSTPITVEGSRGNESCEPPSTLCFKNPLRSRAW